MEQIELDAEMTKYVTISIEVTPNAEKNFGSYTLDPSNIVRSWCYDDDPLVTY